MYCAKCGATNDDNAFKCISCGEVLSRALAMAPDASGLGPATSPLVWAILCTVLCCVPGGIVAIVYSSQVSTKNAEGRYADAHKAAATARTWCWVSFGVGLVATVIIVILQVVAAMATSQP